MTASTRARHEAEARAEALRQEADELARTLLDVEAGAKADWALLVRALAYPAKHVRRHAAGALGAALARGEVDAAAGRGLLASGDAHVRWGAAFALERAGLGDPGTEGAAFTALGDGDADVRWAAAAIVVARAKTSPTLRDTLRGLLGSGDGRERKMALLCLCECGEHDAALYAGALGDDDPYVRMAALTSLARTGARDERSLSAISAVADSDEAANVRRAAGAVLRRLTTAR